MAKKNVEPSIENDQPVAMPIEVTWHSGAEQQIITQLNSQEVKDATDTTPSARIED